MQMRYILMTTVQKYKHKTSVACMCLLLEVRRSFHQDITVLIMLLATEVSSDQDITIACMFLTDEGSFVIMTSQLCVCY